ncbi:MAG TPA: hypothetical protein VF618_22470 [Thermoanaerobaculia bacterium]
MKFFRTTFARAGAFAFLGEGAAHVYVLYRHGGWVLKDLPLWADWFFLLLGGYSSIGLILYAYRVKIRNWRSWAWLRFVTAFLIVSVLLHGYIIVFDPGHRILRIFPWWYSFLGLTYCLAFAWTLLWVKLLPGEE